MNVQLIAPDEEQQKIKRPPKERKLYFEAQMCGFGSFKYRELVGTAFRGTGQGLVNQ